MRNTTWISLVAITAIATAAVSLANEPIASACGGCFAPPPKTSQSPTQVSGHRMAFAISAKRTVLWDQIRYVGSPSEFGWVLPIRGRVDVGVSSDELFERLALQTVPTVLAPPPPTCPGPTPVCRRDCSKYSTVDAGGKADAPPSRDGPPSSVDVWSSSIVGPYEATQLSATDGTALRNWLKDHGYALPPSIAPIIDQYVAEKFGFLAVRLIPEADTTRMVPIRIGFDGGSPVLPLRMVAAGTGAKVGLELFVLGEGRWEAKNFPNAEVPTSSLIWDFAAGGSNFGKYERALLESSGGRTWVTETSILSTKVDLVAGLTPGTTTTEAGTVFSSITDAIELDKAFPSRTDITLTRLVAELPSAALDVDLEIQASFGGSISRTRQAPVGVNFNCPYNGYLVDCPGITPTAEQCKGEWKPGDPIDGADDGATVVGCTCEAAGPTRQTALGILFGGIALANSPRSTVPSR